MSDLPLYRALRMVENLISKRADILYAKARDPTLPSRQIRSCNQRADELGLLLADIRKAINESSDPPNPAPRKADPQAEATLCPPG